jgi:DnaJ-class molecular chaperone
MIFVQPISAVRDLRICKRCGGAGQLLRATSAKLLTYKKCTSCNGRGTRHKVKAKETQ